MSQTKRIALLVSDIDGTLVTADKVLTDANIAAAGRLKAAGIPLSLVSSRPPAGFTMLTKPLVLDGPIGAFNGGAILNPDLSVIEETFVPVESARIALEAFGEFGLDGWVFTRQDWCVLNDAGAYIPREKRTLQREPKIVPTFEPYLDRIGKLVGSSKDFDKVAACETELQARLGKTATAKRSQRYYLDVTPYGFDKGEAVRRIAKSLGLTIEEVAVIGDESNDLSMFAIAGTRIAMGNAIGELKAMADFVSDDNEHSGFATAIDKFILPRVAKDNAA